MYIQVVENTERLKVPLRVDSQLSRLDSYLA